MNDSRRRFIKEAALVSLGFAGLNQFVIRACSTPGIGFGPLSYREGDILSLPDGFTAKVISRKGDLMDDGLISPGTHDGMGVFPGGKGQVILIRNHENTPGSFGAGPFGRNNELLDKIDRKKIYDYAAGSKYMCVGGTTTIIFNEREQKVKQESLSLIGTVRNCAGGITPWNSWITCEETDSRKGDEGGFLEKDHGYNFEVPATVRIGLTDPLPIKPMGRFIHEAVAVHPTEGIVYQTEDDINGLFYRYLPDSYGNLHKGGKLQALAIPEWESADTSNFEGINVERLPQGKQFNTAWIDMDDVEAPDGDLRFRGRKKGAARFAGGEGIWYGENELFFACTAGGRNGMGQIFRYIPSRFEGQKDEKAFPGKLELFLEPNDTDTFQHCDNLTIAPWGDVIICEDKSDPRIIGITKQGQTYVIAKNIGMRESEFAGPVFSPSGNTFFVNIQSPGLTLAITGPWRTR